jgi:hypothetical protein
MAKVKLALSLADVNVTLLNFAVVEENEEDEEEERLGGLFKASSQKQKESRTTVDGTDCSKFIVHSGMDWNIEEVR